MANPADIQNLLLPANVPEYEILIRDMNEDIQYLVKQFKKTAGIPDDQMVKYLP